MADQEELSKLQLKLENLNKEIARLTQGNWKIKDLPAFVKGLGGGVEGLNKAIEDLEDRISRVRNSFDDIANILKSSIRDLKLPDPTKEILSSYSKLESISSKLSQHKKDENILSLKQLGDLQKRIKLETDVLTLALAGAKAEKTGIDSKLEETRTEKEIIRAAKLNEYIKDVTKALEEGENSIHTILELTKEELITEKQIQKTIGITGNIFKGIESTLKKIGIESEFFEDINQNMRIAAKNSNSQFQVLGAGLKTIFSGVNDALSQPIVKLTLLGLLTKGLVKAGLSYSKEIADIGKQYGLTAEAAKGVADYNKDLAFSTKNVLVNQESVAEASQQINEQLGTSVSLGKDLIEGQVNLTKVLGLSGEEAAQLSQYALLYGTTQDKLLQSISKENKGILSNKKVLQEVLKTTGQLAAFYKNSPELLTKAVVQANKLGLSLQKTKDITDGLLDFESSISSEMEAEVLIGKDLNLNAARALALQGDTVGAAEEMLANLGGINEFYNLNRIQQQAIAQALGMSVDDLADTLLKQEKLKVLSLEQKKVIEDMRRAGQDDLADQIEKGVLQGKAFDTTQQQVAAQDKFNASVTKLKDAFVALVSGPLGAMVDGLAQASQWVSSIFNFLGKIPGAGTLGSIVKLIFGTAGVIAAGFLAVKTLPMMLKNLVLGRSSLRLGDPGYVVVTNLPATTGGGFSKYSPRTTTSTGAPYRNPLPSPPLGFAPAPFAQRSPMMPTQAPAPGFAPAPFAQRAPMMPPQIPQAPKGTGIGKFALGGISRSAGAGLGAATGIFDALGAESVGEGVGNVAGGAILGALGSFLGPVGTMIGGALGSKLGGWIGSLFKKKETEKTSQSMFGGMPTFASPEQETPSYAVGGVVQTTGIAKVDQGEVYLGKDTKSTFEKMVNLLEKQTTLLSNIVPITSTVIDKSSKSESNISNKIESIIGKSNKSESSISNKIENIIDKSNKSESNIAQSLGMSVDDLADILSKQEKLTLDKSNKSESSISNKLESIMSVKNLSSSISNNTLPGTSNFNTDKSNVSSSNITKNTLLGMGTGALLGSLLGPIGSLVGAAFGSKIGSDLPQEKKILPPKDISTTQTFQTLQSPEITDKSTPITNVDRGLEEITLDKSTRETFIEMMRALKEHTHLLSIISKKELTINTDKLAYATAKSTAMGYGNPLNSNSYIR